MNSLANLFAANKQPIHGIVGLPRASDSTSSRTEELSFSLPRLQLVDTSALSWKRLLEFRKDNDSRRKLRNLLLFIYDNYLNKSRSYVEDDIICRIEDYNDTVKKWGMRTVESSFQMIFPYKSPAAVLAAGFAAVLGLDVPLSSAAGAVFEIGAITIKITNEKRGLHDFGKDNPVSYIIESNNVATRQST